MSWSLGNIFGEKFKMLKIRGFYLTCISKNLKNKKGEEKQFPLWLSGLWTLPYSTLALCRGECWIPNIAQWIKGFGIDGAAAEVTAEARIQPLAQELPYVLGAAIKKREREKREKRMIFRSILMRYKPDWNLGLTERYKLRWLSQPILFL